jgi:hypothetical protein
MNAAMPAHVRELLMILGFGFVPTLESVACLRWEHPRLPGDVETTESASALCKSKAGVA